MGEIIKLTLLDYNTPGFVTTPIEVYADKEHFYGYWAKKEVERGNEERVEKFDRSYNGEIVADVPYLSPSDTPKYNMVTRDRDRQRTFSMKMSQIDNFQIEIPSITGASTDCLKADRATFRIHFFKFKGEYVIALSFDLLNPQYKLVFEDGTCFADWKKVHLCGQNNFTKWKDDDKTVATSIVMYPLFKSRDLAEAENVFTNPSLYTNKKIFDDILGGY